MHSLYRAIGFSKIKSRLQMEGLYRDVMNSPTRKTTASIDLGTSIIQLDREFGDGIGITLIGEIDATSRISIEHAFPFATPSTLTYVHNLRIEKHLGNDSYDGIIDDFTLNIMFYLQNIADYVHLNWLNKTPLTETCMLSALSNNGSILLPLTRTKDEEIKREIKIFQKRARGLEYGLVKTEKGEIMAAKWNGKIIGKYTGPGLPGPTQSDIAANKFNWGLMDRLVERTAPYDVFTLYDGFLNYCQCGEIDLSKRDFIGHVKDHHRGLIQKGCQLNKPPWLGWILFIYDEVEEAFCYSDEDLDESILTNCLI